MLTDGRTDGRTDDGQKVITIAHPEQSSGELKRIAFGNKEQTKSRKSENCLWKQRTHKITKATRTIDKARSSPNGYVATADGVQETEAKRTD